MRDFAIVDHVMVSVLHQIPLLLPLRMNIHLWHDIDRLLGSHVISQVLIMDGNTYYFMVCWCQLNIHQKSNDSGVYSNTYKF